MKHGKVYTVTGSVYSPDWAKDRSASYFGGPVGWSCTDTAMMVTQVEALSLTKNAKPKGGLAFDPLGWACHSADYGGGEEFSEVKGVTAEGLPIYCLMPSIHGRWAQAHPDYLIGRRLYVYYVVDSDKILRVTKVARIEDVPPKHVKLLMPNIASVAWERRDRSEAKQHRRSNISARLRRDVFMRDGFKCKECGASPALGQVFLEVDHVIPHARGGSSEHWNLQTLCSTCNRAKSDGLPATMSD